MSATKKKAAQRTTATIVLSVRQQPDWDSPIVARITGRGVPLSISEEQGEWGKMANNLGWVPLIFTERA